MTNPFNRERFLFFMLAGIFVWQGVIFSAAVFACFRLGGINACPELGRRWENTSGLMVATTLALLGTSVAAGGKKKDEQPEARRLNHRLRSGVNGWRGSDQGTDSPSF